MNYYYTTELYHHGILGQKLGVRHYQNEDGSLTDDGRRRYNQNNYKEFKRESKRGRNETVATKRFFNENPDLIDKMSKIADKQAKRYGETADLERKREIVETKYGENSKQYKKLTGQINKAYEREDAAYKEGTAAWDGLLQRGNEFLNKNFGDYKNKKIAGLNVRYGRATVEKLFYADIRNNWYKHVPNAERLIDDWEK